MIEFVCVGKYLPHTPMNRIFHSGFPLISIPMKGNNMTTETITLIKGEQFKIRWSFTAKDGTDVNRTCTVFFTGVTMPSDNGISYEVENTNSNSKTDLTAKELGSMYVTTAKAESFDIQVAS